MGIIPEYETLSTDPNSTIDPTPESGLKRKRSPSESLIDDEVVARRPASSEWSPKALSTSISPDTGLTNQGDYLSDFPQQYPAAPRSSSHESNPHQYSKSPHPSFHPVSSPARDSFFSHNTLFEPPHPGPQSSGTLTSLSIPPNFLISASLLHAAETQRRALHRSFSAYIMSMNLNFDANTDKMLHDGKILVEAMDWPHDLQDEELARFYSVTEIFLKVFDHESAEDSDIPRSESPILAEVCKLIPKLRSIVESLHPGLEVNFFPERMNCII